MRNTILTVALAILVATPAAQAQQTCDVLLGGAMQVPRNITVFAHLKWAYIQSEQLSAMERQSCGCPFVTPWDDFIQTEFPGRSIGTVTPIEAVANREKWQNLLREAPQGYNRYFRQECT